MVQSMSSYCARISGLLLHNPILPTGFLSLLQSLLHLLLHHSNSLLSVLSISILSLSLLRLDTHHEYVD